MTTLEYLNAAIAASQDAQRTTELHLGFDAVRDAVDRLLYNTLARLDIYDEHDVKKKKLTDSNTGHDVLQDVCNEVIGYVEILTNAETWPARANGGDAVRAAALRRLVVASAGSAIIDEAAFARHVTLQLTKRIFPRLLRKIGLEDVARKCEEAQDLAAVRVAAAAAWAESTAVSAAAAAAWAKYPENREADIGFKADHVREYADRFVRAIDYCVYAGTSNSAVQAAVEVGGWGNIDVLTLVAEIGVEALQLVTAPGCEFLHLCDEPKEPA